MRGFPSKRQRASRAGTVAVLVASIALTAGCGVYQAGVRTGPSVGRSLPPVDATQVQLFGGDDPALGGEEVGFVVGVADVDEEWLALQRLRNAAAKLGADAIVDLRFEVLQSSQIVARGRAVRRAPVPPMPGDPNAPSAMPQPPVPPPAGSNGGQP